MKKAYTVYHLPVMDHYTSMLSLGPLDGVNRLTVVDRPQRTRIYILCKVLLWICYVLIVVYNYGDTSA